jgi:asparagine synthase (glutamine-hydrolysing)
MIKHRGTRTAVSDFIAHSRLPIVGLSTKHDQPVERGEWTIAFVGEILNFREIAPHLACDVDLVADTWEREGPRGFRAFDGFWSVVAYSDKTRHLYLLTDYLAQKPLYYRTDMAAAASEPDAVACLAPVTVDRTYISSILKWGYCPEQSRTPYNEIKRTVPGELVVLSSELTNGSVVRSEIVDPITPEPVPFYTLKDEIVGATRRRVLSSDVPVACLLSGGLDSSIVYTIASRYADVRPYYVTQDSEQSLFDYEEKSRVYSVAGDAPVTEAHWSSVSDEKCLMYMQEPIDLGSLAPQVALSEAVRENVCLAGDAADEFFGGYSRSKSYDSQWSDVFHELVCYHLLRLDRVMARNLIEIRTPFLARSVVNAALAVPYDMRQDKILLRNLFRDDLPKGIADQQKMPLRPTNWDQRSRSKALVQLFLKNFY